MPQRVSAGSGEPGGGQAGSPGLALALRRHPLVLVISVLVLVGAGAVVGLARTPVYTARAKLTVGNINLAAPGALSGYAQATQALAAGYSRAIDANAVVQPVSRQVGLSPKTVRDRLSATPVPQSPVFRISATGPHGPDAIRLANAASSALLTYVTNLNRATPDSGRLYARFSNAARRANAHRATERRLAAAIASARNPPSELRAALVRSKTAVDVANLRTQALRQAYVTALAGQSSTELAQMLAPASSSSSDRRSKLEIAMFLGLVAGLVLGAGLAVLRDSRRSAAH